jgi:hypothetical protein
LLKESNSGMGQAAAGIGTAAEVEQRQRTNGGINKTAAVGVDQRQESISGRSRAAAGSRVSRSRTAAGVKQRQGSNSSRGPIQSVPQPIRLNLHSQPNLCHTASNYQPTDPIRTITDPVQLTLYNQPSYCTDPKYRLTKPIHITTVLFCLQFKSTRRDKKPKSRE